MGVRLTLQHCCIILETNVYVAQMHTRRRRMSIGISCKYEEKAPLSTQGLARWLSPRISSASEDDELLYRSPSQARQLQPSGLPPPDLPEKWQQQYRESSATFMAETRVLQLALISACPGTGKSSLINHLVGQNVAEVYINCSGRGSTRETATLWRCGKQPWTIRDCPAARGIHAIESRRAALGSGMASLSEKARCKVAEYEASVPAGSRIRYNLCKLSTKATRMARNSSNNYAHKQKKLAENKDFVKAYSLSKPDRAEVLALVISAEHTKEQLLEERKLITCRELHAVAMPVLVVVTHSNDKTDRDRSRRLLKSLGLAAHPCVRVVNVNLAAWDGRGRSPYDTVKHNRMTADFPALMSSLRDCSFPDSLARVAMINRMVRAKIDEAVKDLERPGLGQYAWVLATHTGLAFVAPIAGPMAETFTRMMLLALCIYESVGLLRPGSAKAAERGVEGEVRKRRKEKKTQTIYKEVGKGTAETAVVTGVETGLKEGASGLGQLVYEATKDLALNLSAEAAGEVIYGALPVVGALVSMATMPHSYKHMALGAKKIAYRRHAAWVAANSQELRLFD